MLVFNKNVSLLITIIFSLLFFGSASFAVTLDPEYASIEQLQEGYEGHYEKRHDSEYNYTQYVAFSGWLGVRHFKNEDYREGARYLGYYFIGMEKMKIGYYFEGAARTRNGREFSDTLSPVLYVLLSFFDRKWKSDRDFNDIEKALTYITHAIEETVEDNGRLLRIVYKKLASYAHAMDYKNEYEEYNYLAKEAGEMR